jgi:hypothetical protein
VTGSNLAGRGEQAPSKGLLTDQICLQGKQSREEMLSAEIPEGISGSSNNSKEATAKGDTQAEPDQNCNGRVGQVGKAAQQGSAAGCVHSRLSRRAAPQRSGVIPPQILY